MVIDQKVSGLHIALNYFGSMHLPFCLSQVCKESTCHELYCTTNADGGAQSNLTVNFYTFTKLHS